MLHIVSAGYKRHTKPFLSRGVRNVYLIRLQIEGYCRAYVNNVMYELGPGDLLLCKPGDSYQLRVLQDDGDVAPVCDYFINITSDAWMTGWWIPFQGMAKLTVDVDDQLLAIWRSILSEKRRINDCNLAILDGLTRSLLLTLQRQAGGELKMNRYEHGVAVRIKRYVEDNAATPFRLRDAALAAGLGVSRASQIFRQAYGQSIMDYAIDVRLSIAKEQMSATDFTLAQIAEACGFSNYTHFNRLFRSRFNLSPSQYRKEFSF